MRIKTYLPGLTFLATLAGVGYLLESGLVQNLMSQSWIDAQVRGKGVSGELLFVAVGGAATALAVPRQIVSFLGGYAFGLSLGTALALAATELGCVLAYYYARIIGRPLAARLGARVRRIEDFLNVNPFSMTLLIRLLPVGNNLATCLAAGVARVRARPFLLGSCVGYLPQTFVFALAGSGVDTGRGLHFALAAVLFVASGALSIWLYRKYHRGKSLGEDVEKSI